MLVWASWVGPLNTLAPLVPLTLTLILTVGGEGSSPMRRALTATARVLMEENRGEEAYT